MGSTFLSEFMMISNINTVLFIVLLIGYFCNQQNKEKFKFH